MQIFANLIAIVLILMFVAWLFLKMFGKYLIGAAAFLTAIGLGALVTKYIRDKRAEPAPIPEPQADPHPGVSADIVPFEHRKDESA